MMNEQIKQLADRLWRVHPADIDALGLKSRTEFYEHELKKFAELIVRECTTLLFNESERLYEYSTECDNMRESDEAEVVAEKCVDLITMIEQHFGVE
jgi:hypothetical protein